MCVCTPEIKTPWCGKPGCEAPPSITKTVACPGWYQHVDGGVYRTVRVATHSEDGELYVIYDHVWPFDPAAFVRPSASFMERFLEITEAEAQVLIELPRERWQQRITKAKVYRRAAEEGTSPFEKAELLNRVDRQLANELLNKDRQLADARIAGMEEAARICDNGPHDPANAIRAAIQRTVLEWVEWLPVYVQEPNKPQTARMIGYASLNSTRETFEALFVRYDIPPERLLEYKVCTMYSIRQWRLVSSEVLP